MPNLTKQDIDALWAAHRARIKGSIAMNQEDTYLAAGLTATGERKPERVRCWSYRYNGAGPYVSSLDPNGSDFAADITPGWFVPDGAE